jgi:hypothetical protein
MYFCSGKPMHFSSGVDTDEFLGPSDVAGDIETANKLIWAGAVANETMRLRPVTPILFLEAKVETVVGDLLVPEGTRVFVLTRPAACDADHFAEPQAFRPRRWLGEHAGAQVGGAEGVRENFAFAMSPVSLNVRLRRRSSALVDTGTA